MKRVQSVLYCLAGFFVMTLAVQGATISGTVKEAGGAPLKGVFVEARNTSTKIATMVLSDKNGQYWAQNLAPGDYQVRAVKVGYKATAPAAVKLAEGQPASLNFQVQKGKVRWSDLSAYEGQMLLPDGEGKKDYFDKCLGCHGFESRMAATRRDLEGWQRAVSYMRNEMRVSLNRFTDEDQRKVAGWLNQVFGVDSDLPASPEDVPEFKKYWRGEFSDDAMNIVYTVYDLPSPPDRFPYSGRPDKNGMIWMPFYHGNGFGVLNPSTGKTDVFVVPSENDPVAGTRLAVHGLDVTADARTVWGSATDADKLWKLDQETHKITVFLPPKELPAGSNRMGLRRGATHDIDIDSKGNVWSSGAPLRRFDPKTEQWTQIADVPNCYAITIDKDDNVWYTEFRKGGVVGKVDSKTLKVTKYNPPNKESQPRRAAVDSQGMVWFTDWTGGFFRFDPKAETFEEYRVPDPDATPYAIALDRNNHVWYTSHEMDYLGRLDPESGKFSKYPLPVSDIGTREMFFDSKGTLWVVSPPNDKVFAVTIAQGSSAAAVQSSR